jgi:hypothetical protein
MQSNGDIEWIYLWNGWRYWLQTWWVGSHRQGLQKRRVMMTPSGHAPLWWRHQWKVINAYISGTVCPIVFKLETWTDFGEWHLMWRVSAQRTSFLGWHLNPQIFSPYFPPKTHFLGLHSQKGLKINFEVRSWVMAQMTRLGVPFMEMGVIFPNSPNLPLFYPKIAPISPSVHLQWYGL